MIFNFYAQIISREFLVDTIHMYICMCYIKQLAIKTKHFRYYVLISEFVVVAILCEWWLFYLNGGRCRPL